MSIYSKNVALKYRHLLPIVICVITYLALKMFMVRVACLCTMEERIFEIIVAYWQHYYMNDFAFTLIYYHIHRFRIDGPFNKLVQRHKVRLSKSCPIINLRLNSYCRSDF